MRHPVCECLQRSLQAHMIHVIVFDIQQRANPPNCSSLASRAPPPVHRHKHRCLPQRLFQSLAAQLRTRWAGFRLVGPVVCEAWGLLCRVCEQPWVHASQQQELAVQRTLAALPWHEGRAAYAISLCSVSRMTPAPLAPAIPAPRRLSTRVCDGAMAPLADLRSRLNTAQSTSALHLPSLPAWFDSHHHQWAS